MSFYFTHSAESILSSLDRGLLFDESGPSTDWTGATQLLADNFTALEDYTANQATTLVTGTLDGSGNATVAHAISTAFGLLSAQAWCKGASAAEFLPCVVASVDDTNVSVTGGTAGRDVRVFLVYSIVPPGW